MSSQPNSSTAAVATDSRPPPEPPEELKRHLQGGKVIFFTLDTLFNRNHANECALERCRELNKDLRNKSMEELKRAYRDAMAAAYQHHIYTQLHGPCPGGSGTPQASMDKVGMMFQQLDLNPPSRGEGYRIGGEFAAEFSRNSFEVPGTSQSLAQLRNLKYAIVVADDNLDWEGLKHLDFWQYINANIISRDPLVRKPDPRVFQEALKACGVSPKNAVIVGCSIEKDIAGIIAAGAEPILYMPGHTSTVMDVRGMRVLVVRTMVELLSEIQHRPENSHLVPAQHRPPLVPPFPSHPTMVNAPQTQGHPDTQKGGPSSQHHYQVPSQSPYPAPGPKSVEDGHAGQYWERARPSPILSEHNETPRRRRLPDRDHSTRDIRAASPLVEHAPKPRCDGPRPEHGYAFSPPVVPRRQDQREPHHDPARGHYDPAGKPSPGPSTQSPKPRAAQPAWEARTPNGDGPGSSSTRSSSPVYTPPSPTLPTPLPSMRMFPPTEDYGISMPAHVESLDWSPPSYDGCGHGTVPYGSQISTSTSTQKSVSATHPKPLQGRK
ncbi:hypothetical protein FDENT_2251 [Fusarium denticulatum]|uniref:Uncharacterized protein n=1 Tax=Fusarium denticulatum TaxID=48507 RepID=A0A8H5XGI9_9HYPO|nr:hypothetical protein FDENT_2251 [Fusarium denticulatum]